MFAVIIGYFYYFIYVFRILFGNGEAFDIALGRNSASVYNGKEGRVPALLPACQSLFGLSVNNRLVCTIECVFGNIFKRTSERNRAGIGFCKSITAYRFDVFGNCDITESRAVERIVAYFLYSFAEVHFAERGSSVESAVFYSFERIGQFYRGKTGFVECRITYFGNVAFDYYVFKQ